MKTSSLIIASAIAAAATAQPAHAETTLTMACEGYGVVFSHGRLASHAPNKDRDYPVTKVDVQNDRTIVTGITKYGKITAFFSNDGHPSIVWTNGKDVVLNQCGNDVATVPQQSLQTGRSEASEAASRAEAAAQRAERAANAATKYPQDPWDAAVDGAIALSSWQNHGTPRYLHFCEPKLKACSDVVAYKSSDGLRVAFQIHKDSNGATINRLVCKLNEKEDVRICTDFDTKTETTSMQDVDGNWQDITDDEPTAKPEPKGAVHF